VKSKVTSIAGEIFQQSHIGIEVPILFTFFLLGESCVVMCIKVYNNNNSFKKLYNLQI